VQKRVNTFFERNLNFFLEDLNIARGNPVPAPVPAPAEEGIVFAEVDPPR